MALRLVAALGILRLNRENDWVCVSVCVRACVGLSVVILICFLAKFIKTQKDTSDYVNLEK